MPVIEIISKELQSYYVFAHKYTHIWSSIMPLFSSGRYFWYISEVQFCPDNLNFCAKIVFFSTFFFISRKVWVPNDYEFSGQLVCLNCNFLSKVNVLLLNFDLRQHAYPTKSVENWEFTFKKLFCWIEGIKVKTCPCAINIPWKCSLWS